MCLYILRTAVLVVFLIRSDINTCLVFQDRVLYREKRRLKGYLLSCFRRIAPGKQCTTAMPIWNTRLCRAGRKTPGTDGSRDTGHGLICCFFSRCVPLCSGTGTYVHMYDAVACPFFVSFAAWLPGADACRIHGQVRGAAATEAAQARRAL